MNYLLLISYIVHQMTSIVAEQTLRLLLVSVHRQYVMALINYKL